MENPTKYLNLAAELINKRQGRLNRAAHLCHYEGGLKLLKSNHTKLPHPVFVQITKTDLEDGLTSEQWKCIGTKLANFYGARNQCPEPSKQSVSKNPKNCSTNSSAETSPTSSGGN